MTDAITNLSYVISLTVVFISCDTYTNTMSQIWKIRLYIYIYGFQNDEKNQYDTGCGVKSKLYDDIYY